jgi:hypothetical protein
VAQTLAKKKGRRLAEVSRCRWLARARALPGEGSPELRRRAPVDARSWGPGPLGLKAFASVSGHLGRPGVSDELKGGERDVVAPPEVLSAARSLAASTGVCAQKSFMPAALTLAFWSRHCRRALLDNGERAQVSLRDGGRGRIIHGMSCRMP